MKINSNIFLALHIILLPYGLLRSCDSVYIGGKGGCKNSYLCLFGGKKSYFEAKCDFLPQ